VPEPTSAGDFRFHTVDPTPTLQGPDAHLAVVGGRLQMIYHRDIGLLMFARALASEPAARADWQIHQIDAGARPNARNSLSVVDGRIVFAYMDTTNRHLKVARQLNTRPTQASDWELRTVDDAPEVGRFSGCVPWAEGIAVGYVDQATDQLKLALAQGVW